MFYCYFICNEERKITLNLLILELMNMKVTPESERKQRENRNKVLLCLDNFAETSNSFK